MNYAVPTDHRVKIKESEKRDKYLDLARKLITKHEGDGGINITVTKGLVRHINQRKRRDHPDYIFIKIGQNTEKIPGD